MRHWYQLTGRIYGLLTRSERRSLGLLFGLMLIGMVVETIGIGFVIPVIAVLTQPDYVHHLPAMQAFARRFGGASHRTLIVAAMVGLSAVFLFKALFLAFLSWRQHRFAFGVQASLSERLFAVYLHQPYTFHLQRNSAQLIRNTINEVNYFSARAITPGLQLIAESLVVAGLCTLLVFVEPAGALIVVAVLGGAGLMFYRITTGRTAYWGRERQHHDGLRIQHLQQGLGGAKDVKLLGREDNFIEEYRVHSLQSARASRYHAVMQQVGGLWFELLAVLGVVCVVLVMTFRGRSPETIVPIVGLFAVVAFRLMPSANRILLAVQSLRYGLPAIDTLHAEMQLAEAVEPTTDPTTRPAPFERDIELADVTYVYPAGAAPALNRAALVIRRGECVGFVGASGSGKSTLINVILGLLPPTSGHVRVDGRDIQLDLRAWQDQIGYVPQSIYLTDDTLRRNVAFGLPHRQIDDAAVARAIKAAQLEDFVETLPAGLETMVGERGVRISGGQMQRIGIARALYHDPSVLVLDEATSALDSTTEAGVMDAVDALHGTKTILIVAHRLSTVAHCDRLYRLESGRVDVERAA